VTPAEQLAAFASQLTFAALPAPVVDSVLDRIIDTVGICIAGADGESAPIVRSIVDELGGPPRATAVGLQRRVPAAAAALVNGTAAHGLDFDDTHLPSVAHPSACLVPAVLAQAEECGADGATVVVALAAGYEVFTRLAMAQYDPELRNSVFFEHGLHATSILGTVAAAVACARVQNLDAERTMHTLAIACSMGSGIIEANRSGGNIKPFHCGWAAHGAVIAARLAMRGLTGPPTVLEGKFGLFAAFCHDNWHPEALTEKLGERWDGPDVFFKPYPCNHFTHAVVDAAVALRQRGLRLDDVDHVTIGTAGPSWRTIGDPIVLKRRPLSPHHARFSAPFVFATALSGGGGLGVSMSDFTETTIHDEALLTVADRCDVVVDAECTAEFPYQFPAVVTVRTRDGSVVEERIYNNRGGPNWPLTKDELRRKLATTAGHFARDLEAQCRALANASSIDGLFPFDV
jgi:2-methylcitrate dehydratase PrpD